MNYCIKINVCIFQTDSHSHLFFYTVIFVELDSHSLRIIYEVMYYRLLVDVKTTCSACDIERVLV